ncbi:PE-PGRS family protein [Mycobacterium tuberculosis CPHL_A]|nr:PE-PGRS family protein [Mycobacterium tuberculosis CPHL_A]
MRIGRCQMSFVIAAPEVIAAAATDLASLESSIAAANAAAAANTTALLARGPMKSRRRLRRCSAPTARPIRRSAPKRRRFMPSSCRR